MFKVDHIDHVELFVPDRHEAARWYERTLGLAALPQHEDWAADPGGPLMISSNGGGTMLALFTGEPRRSRPTAGFHRVAFRVDGPGFVQFLEHVRENPVCNEAGEEIRSLTPHDHHQAFSVYFTRSLGAPVGGDDVRGGVRAGPALGFREAPLGVCSWYETYENS